MICTLLLILLGWYFFVYRTSKEKYEKRWNKKLRFRDSLDPQYWDKI